MGMEGSYGPSSCFSTSSPWGRSMGTTRAPAPGDPHQGLFSTADSAPAQRGRREALPLSAPRTASQARGASAPPGTRRGSTSGPVFGLPPQTLRYPQGGRRRQARACCGIRAQDTPHPGSEAIPSTAAEPGPPKGRGASQVLAAGLNSVCQLVSYLGSEVKARIAVPGS